MRVHWKGILAGAWRLVSILIALALLGGAIAWMSGSLHTKVAPGTLERQSISATGRSFVPVETLATTETVDAVGTIQPRRRTDVASQILATIREIHVNAGDRVEQGQPLVVLDDREVQAQLRDAEAAAAAAQADVDVRQRDLERYTNLLKKNAASVEEFDRAEAAYKTAAALLRRAEEQIARIRVLVTYTTINAQMAGIVADRYLDPGDLAVPGKPIITLHDPQERELHASVPESLASGIKLGMEMAVRVDAVDRQCHGVVREIVPQAQQGSRAVLVKLTLPPQAVDVVYIGMFGRVAVPIGETKRVVVPAAAVQQVGQQDLVDVARPDGALERRFIRTGRRFGDKVEVLSGIEVGEQVALPEA